MEESMYCLGALVSKTFSNERNTVSRTFPLQRSLIATNLEIVEVLFGLNTRDCDIINVGVGGG